MNEEEENEDLHDSDDSHRPKTRTPPCQKTPTKKKRRACLYNSDWEQEFSWVNKCFNDQTKAKCKLCSVTFTVAYDGVKALTQHGETQKHIKNVHIVTASQRMSSFLVTKDSSQNEKVTVAELTHIYHGVKHHISFVAQDCSVKVMKQVLQDSDIVKKMTAGRTKTSAIVNTVLYPFSLELVMNDLKNGTPFSIATDASNK